MRKGKGRGANFGWRPFEGNDRFTPGESAPGAIKPVITEKHSDGNCSITGGVIIRDPKLPAWRGRYVFGDFCRGVIQTAVLSSGAREEPDRPQAEGLAAVLVRRGRARPGLRDLARRPGLPFRAVIETTRASCAPNPSPLTLTGTNTWVVGRDPAWVVDPGPAIESHLDAVAAEVAARGGAGGIALTHDHADHSEAIEPLRARLGDVPVARRHLATATRSARSTCSSSPATPTTTSCSSPAAPPSRATRCWARAACSSPGGCASTSTGCGGCARWSWSVIYPGHGDPVTDPAAKLDEYLAHRAERERKLLAALEAGARDRGRAARRRLGRRARRRPPVRRDLDARAPREAARRGPSSRCRRSRPSSSAAASGVVPEAAAESKIVRSVSPTTRTLCVGAGGVVARRARARRRC